MKTIRLEVENHWMDSLETAYVDITSPTGKTIKIRKINLVNFNMEIPLSCTEKSTLQRLLKETGNTPWKWEPDIFKATITEMKILLGVSLRCSTNL